MCFFLKSFIFSTLLLIKFFSKDIFLSFAVFTKIKHLIQKSCLRGCTDLYVKTNQRLTQQFMTHTPDMVKRRTEEMKQYEQKQQASPTIIQQVDDNSQTNSSSELNQ